MKHYTSIEQSKKLLELGLNPQSADMYYLIIAEDEYSKYPRIGDKENILDEFPCWSVGALLDLMPTSPKSVRISKNCDGNYDLGYENFETKEYLYMIDACFEMTVWLLENEYLKKEE